MTSDATAPATKQDIAMIMEAFVHAEIRMDAKIEEFKQEILVYVDDSAKETRRHFDVMVETLHHNLVRGALNDKVQQHEDRILVLERRAGVR
jgi:hypothetical protein